MLCFFGFAVFFFLVCGFLVCGLLCKGNESITVEDERYHRAMVNTCKDMVSKFNVNTAYTKSDEIILIWNECMSNENPNYNHLFNGRIVKMSSVLSGFASVRFAYHLKLQDFTDQTMIFRDRINNCFTHFNARCFNLPNSNEVLNFVLWRNQFNATRFTVLYACVWVCVYVTHMFVYLCFVLVVSYWQQSFE